MEFPAIFGQNLQGVRLKENLARNEPLIYIPNKCIISTEHARVSPIGHLFDSHDNLFVCNNDRDTSILLVYICYERLKGEESFYHPYFEMIESTLHATYWPEEVIEKSDIKTFKLGMKDSKLKYESDWEMTMNFFSIYPDFFDPARTNKDLFLWALSLLHSRCFGWGLPTTMLVPLADCLNHAPRSGMDINLIEKNLHKSMNKIYLYKHQFEEVDEDDDNVDKIYDKTSSRLPIKCTKLFSEDE